MQVIAGKDKGKTGTVERALPRDNTVIVEGVNVRKRHRRPRRMGQQGQIVEVNQPIDVSNVMIIDPKTNEPTRVGMHVKEDGSKVRVTKKSGTELS